ncbi:sulfatase-like hydrolase/transferase [Tundrisphaera lichenicola]|uniref:sulfatase-like hydrolase/transferase n=1 Tax=Tundrisphaera lichenicola TaxID=2029860 RepID=UPI003EBA1223
MNLSSWARTVVRILGVFWLCSAAPASFVQAEEVRRPNIIVLLADDMGYADVGFQGCRDIPTPHLDALSRASVRCTNGYVSGPYCSPSRAGLLTGRYQQRFGHEFNPERDRRAGLPVSEITLVERLRSAGYATGLIGKWHLGIAPRFHPQKRGFDEFFGFLGGMHTYFAGSSRDIYRGTKAVQEPVYLTHALSREAESFLDRHQDSPFFLEVAFNAVHTPMDATDDRLARFSSIPNQTRRTYAAMMSAMDDAIGVILNKVHSLGLEEETLIFFLSDNGGPTLRGTTVNGSRNDPFRGSKRTTLEGGIHVPFLVKWKGRLPAGSVYDQPVIQLDILPTALAAAGFPIPAEWGVDGVDLLPHLLGRKEMPPHDTLYWRLGPQAAIRRGDWKLVRYDLQVEATGLTVSASRSEPAVGPFRLYNLTEDLGEKSDLSSKHPDKVRELTLAWEEWNHQLAHPLWGPGGEHSGNDR